MTIYNLVANAKGLAVTQTNNSPFPTEIWDAILKIFAQNSSFAEIAQTSRTCKFFLKYFFENCSFFHKRHHSLYFRHFLLQVKGIPSNESVNLTEFKTGFNKFLAEGRDGRQYFCPKAQYESDILYILNFSPQKNAFHLEELKLAEENSSTLNINHFDSRIIAFHPLTDGFVLVTQSSATLWKFENDKPIFKKFITPESWRNKDSIYNSSLQKNTLILHNANLSRVNSSAVHTWSFFDVEENNSEKIATRISKGQPHLVSHESGLSLVTYDFELEEIPKVEIEKVHVESDDFQKLKRGFLQSDASYQFSGLSFRQISENWLVLFNKDNYLCIVDLKTNEMVIDEKRQIVDPFDPNNNRTNCIFIKDGYLFLFYRYEAIRVIFLPTKEEYTEQITPFLKPHLKKDLKIYTIHFARDKDKGAYFTVFFQKHDEYALIATSTEIIQFNFYLEKVNPYPPPAEKKPLETTQPKFVIRKSAPNSTYAKISIVAGIAFLLIGVAGYFVLRQHLAGSILYQGHGISLRAQDAALIVGGLLSLPLLAIGSYKWWKASQRN